MTGHSQSGGRGLLARLSSAPALLLVGLLLVVGVSATGRSDVLVTLLSPPTPARLLLGVAALVIGTLIVLVGADRMRTDRDPRALIRTVRLLFVAVGVFASAIGWLIGSPVPVVAGLVITAIDLLETSFLLLVTGARGSRDGEDGRG